MNVSHFVLRGTSLCSLGLLASMLSACAPTTDNVEPIQQTAMARSSTTYVVKRASIQTPSSKRLQQTNEAKTTNQREALTTTSTTNVKVTTPKPSAAKTLSVYQQTVAAPTPKPTIARTPTRSSGLTREQYHQRYQAELLRKEAEQERLRLAQLEQERKERLAKAEIQRRRAAATLAKRQAEAKMKEVRVQQAASKVENVIQTAKKHLGTKYVWGGASPTTGFDCSGLVQHSLKTGANVKVPRTAAEQYSAAVKVKNTEATRGDLVFFKTRGNRVSHVGIYLGNGRFLHAPRTGKSITTSELTGYWQDRLVGFGRIPGACRVPV